MFFYIMGLFTARNVMDNVEICIEKEKEAIPLRDRQQYFPVEHQADKSFKTIEILIPCYDEADNIENFYRHLMEILNLIVGYEFSLVFVNDGSVDRSLDIIKKLAENDGRVCYIDLSRNFGKEAAMAAGIDYFRGDALIIMDVDLQDPPEVLPDMIAWWEKGYMDVSAKRKKREKDSFCKKCLSHFYYKILDFLSETKVQRDVGDFRLLDKKCVDALKLMRESQRYTKGLFTWVGYSKKEVLIDRGGRYAGESKWNYWKLFNLALEGITGSTIMPLRISTFLGLSMAGISFIYLAFVVIKTLLYGDPVPGYPSMISIILFIGGMQFLVLGIMGEYIGRIFKENKHRPLYFVNEIGGKRNVP